MRRISILGATGSIGQNTIDLIKRNRTDYQVVALTGGRNIEKLARDAVDLDAEVAVTCFPELYENLATALAGTDVKVAAGSAEIVAAASQPADWIMSAIVGAAGLAPSLAALQNGNTLALANKESLVMAGPLLLERAREIGARILPVDSEHSAVFQALAGEDAGKVEKVTITASGGAFRDWPLTELATATPAQAATHPNWDMGQRITIDSASMFNKAMELIETKEYFGISPLRIEALIHPESLVHAIVQYCDGAMMAHIGPHDMRHAIGYALHWPERRKLPVERLDLAAIGALNFSRPDQNRYPALGLAYRVMDEGGYAGTVFNAAKEQALDGFIGGHITFTQMADVVARTMDKMSSAVGLKDAAMTLDNILEVNTRARREAAAVMNALG